MPSLRTGSPGDEISFSHGLEKWSLRRTSVTGLRVSITHLILSRAPSHVFERLIAVIASLASWRTISTRDNPARCSVSRSTGVLGRRSVRGEKFSEAVAMVNRVVFVVVVTASSMTRRAFSAGDISAGRPATAGVFIWLGR